MEHIDNLTYDELKEAYRFLNEQMMIFEQMKDMNLAINHLLEAIGKYVQANRVQLLKALDGYFFVSNEWNNGDSKKSNMCWLPKLEQRDFVYIESPKRIFAFPMFDDSRLLAWMVIEEANKQKINTLAEIYKMLSGWLTYRLIKKDYLKRDFRVRKLLSGLGNEYTAVYIINLDTDAFEIIINQKSNNVAKEDKYEDFSTYLANYADKYVLDNYRELMKKEMCSESLKAHFETETDFYFRFRSVPNELGQTNFEAHAVRQYGEEGHLAVVGYRCVDTIIRKELEYQIQLDKAYKMLQQQLDIITEAIPGGIKISYDDEKYSFKYVSKQYAAMLGYTVEEFMEASGGTIVGIAHPDDLETGIGEALAQYEKGDTYAITYRMRCKDGSYKYIEDHGHKVKNEDGTIEHWNLILDKNELIEKTIALESARKVDEAKTNFLTRMSHDIRTPLNGIIGILEYEDRHSDDLELINTNRKKAEVAASHLLSLVNDILELNKLDSQNVKLTNEVFDLRKLMEEVKSVADMKAAEEGVCVHLGGLDKLKNSYVHGSTLHVRQVLMNIITNGIKYNKVGGSVWVDVKELGVVENTVTYRIRIEDSGIGMSKGLVKKIFSPFTQGYSNARTVYQGTGLGMSIVKSLVDKMGGTIEVDSEPNVGTTIEITLGFELADSGEIPDDVDTKATVDLTGLEVLLVEDNELNMEIAKYLLEDENVIVTEAYNGEEAVDIFKSSQEGSFDIILMDIMMPVMDGLAATRKIRSLKRWDAETIPIFAMTANAFAEDREKSKAAGMNEHLAKPLDSKLLFRKMSQYCRG